MANTAAATPINALLAAALGGEGPDEARFASALRLRCRLQPAGGPGTKVMPPTYSGAGNAPVYVIEQRRIGDDVHDCILLDGVASQANRMEEALAAAIELGEAAVPTIEVDQAEYGRRSGLQFSHRCFDAWIEDAEYEGTRFGETPEFAALATTTSRRDLTAMLGRFPVGVVLGCWASRAKNPQGTTRLARILVSEIVAVDAVRGERPKGKLDAVHVSAAVPIYESARDGERFTLDAEAAVKEKGKPRRFPSKKEPGKPSAAGYGNVTPGLADHGGITMSHALQIATISLPALRECSFPVDGARDAERDVAGRMVIAALAIRMLALQLQRGYDLRSGCLLTTEEEAQLELVGRLGRTVSAWPLIELDAAGLLERSVALATGLGLPWETEPLRLVASEPQLALLRASLEHAAEEE